MEFNTTAQAIPPRGEDTMHETRQTVVRWQLICHVLETMLRPWLFFLHARAIALQNTSCHNSVTIKGGIRFQERHLSVSVDHT